MGSGSSWVNGMAGTSLGTHSSMHRYLDPLQIASDRHSAHSDRPELSREFLPLPKTIYLLSL